MMRSVGVAAGDDVREGRPLRVRVGDLDIVMFRIGSEIFAVNNVCAHQHLTVLHEGEINGHTVSCPMHGWTYDLRTGRATSGQGRIATYPVRIENGTVFVEVSEEH